MLCAVSWSRMTVSNLGCRVGALTAIPLTRSRPGGPYRWHDRTGRFHFERGQAPWRKRQARMTLRAASAKAFARLPEGGRRGLWSFTFAAAAHPVSEIIPKVEACFLHALDEVLLVLGWRIARLGFPRASVASAVSIWGRTGGVGRRSSVSRLRPQGSQWRTSNSVSFSVRLGEGRTS